MKNKSKLAAGNQYAKLPAKVKGKSIKPNLSSLSQSRTCASTKFVKKQRAILKKRGNIDYSKMTIEDFMKGKVDEDSDIEVIEIPNRTNGRAVAHAATSHGLSVPSSEEDEVAESTDQPKEGNSIVDDEDCGEDEDDDVEYEDVDEELVDEESNDEEYNNSNEDALEEDNSQDYADPTTGDDEDDEDEGMSAAGHKKSLQKLQDTDPEFYKYLEANDKKLLQFNVSDSDSDEEEDKYHRPEKDLEVGSDDESDIEVEVEEGVITMKMIREWQEHIQTDKSLATIADVVSGFHAAIIRVTSVEESCKFKVDGSAVFNGVVQLCVLELQPAIKRFLRLPTGSAGKHIQLQKCKKWKKIKPQLKSYLLNLLKLLGGISSPHIMSVLLKHFHQMTQFVACFAQIARKAAKQLITVWGSGEDSTRVIAFLCILRLANTEHSLLDTVLKQMYLSYISNSKFTSPSTLAGINFMRRSLAEMFSLDDSMSYQHVFLYIRQLAIHLRNAVTLQKKETTQAVLNWQFVHSLHLWSDLLGVNTTALQPLLYPLVQIIIGTIKLIPTTQYFPLRFHLTQMLIDLSRRTNTFIPILPFLHEVLTSYDMNRRHKKVSMKPMDLTCVLRVSKLEQTENSFKDAVVELIYQQMLQYLAQEAHCIGFPDITLPALLQLRKFLKVCKVSNYCKKIKSLVDKMEENSRWIEKARSGIVLVLSDRKAVDAWETSAKLRGPPLAAFYASFQAVNKRVLAKRATDNDKLGEYNIPIMKKHVKKEGAEKPVVLFPSDDESESDTGVVHEDSPPPKKKAKRTRKKREKKLPAELQSHEDEDGIQEDIVQDLKLEDF